MNVRSIGVSESGYNEVLALEELNVVDFVERKRRAELPASVSAPHAVAAALSFQACLQVCICACCMCVRVFVYVCVCMNMHVCIYLHVYMYGYTHACIYMCICMCMHVCV